MPRHFPVYFTPPEVARLLEAAYRHRSPPISLRGWTLLAFVYGTDLRVSEALGLTFS